MKHDSEQQIDLLLSRYGRSRGPAGTRATTGRGNGEDARGGSGGAHLDADEMSAYAEGALPPVARSRYTAHLADCDSCRGMVVELARTAEAAAGTRESSAAPGPSPFQSILGFITALLSPPVLKFAVPSLALLALATVAVLYTRERRQAPMIAQNERAASSAAPQPEPSRPEAYDHSSGTNANTAANTATATTPSAATTAPVGNPSPAATVAEKQKAGAIGGKAESATADKPVAADGNTGTVAAAKAPAAPAPAPAAGEVAAKKAEADRKTETDEVRVARNQQEEPSQQAPSPRDDSEANNTRSQNREEQANEPKEVTINGRADDQRKKQKEDRALAKAGPSSTTRGITETEQAAGARSRRSTATKSAGKDVYGGGFAPEVRSAGGRQFRRQGDAWVDTAYKSSLPMVDVARDSEQFRAVAADNPQIGTIARQLDGEIVVVLKGKAYHIY